MNSTKEEFKKNKGNGEQGMNFKNVMILFRDPNQWLTWLAIGLGYTAYVGMTYISPLLASEFGVEASIITVLDTIKNSGIGLIAPLIAGFIATKKGAVRSYFLWLGLYIVSMVLIIVLPWQPAFAVIAILTILLLSFSAKGRSAISNTVLVDIKTPMYLFGTSVGIEALIMRIPDIFMFTLAGNMIDTYGNTGYYMVFGGCLVFALAGMLCNVVLVLGGAAPVPVRLNEVEEFLAGREITLETAKEAGEIAVKHAMPMSKTGYKVQEIKAMVKSAVMRLA